MELFLSDSWPGRSIHGKLAQKCNTYLQCVNACWDGGYANIVAMTCHMLLHKYDAHAASHIFHMSQIGNEPFHQTICFVNFDLDL